MLVPKECRVFGGTRLYRSHVKCSCIPRTHVYLCSSTAPLLLIFAFLWLAYVDDYVENTRYTLYTTLLCARPLARAPRARTSKTHYSSHAALGLGDAVLEDGAMRHAMRCALRRGAPCAVRFAR